MSDNGKEFTADTFEEMAKRLQKKPHFTTPYHVQSNVMTEAFNKLLKNTLSLLVQAEK